MGEDIHGKFTINGEKSNNGEFPNIESNNNAKNQDLNVNSSEKFCKWRQAFACFSIFYISITFGVVIGYSAILLPQLELPDSPLKVDSDMASWIASTGALSMCPGALFSGWLMDMIGRKLAFQIAAVPGIIGFILVACTNNINVLILGRLFSGFSAGLHASLGPAFVGEITSANFRSTFLPALSLSGAVGIICVHLLGTFLHWKTVSYILAGYAFSSLIAFSFVKESPLWLIKKGRLKEARESFVWFRGSDKSEMIDFDDLVENHDQNKSTSSTFKDKMSILKTKSALKPMFLVLVAFASSQYSGYLAVAFYAVQIIKSTIGDSGNEYLYMIILDIFRLGFAVLACYVVRTLRRRVLVFVGFIATALVLFGLALFLFFTDGTDTSNISWIPICLLLLYIALTSAFITPVPWVLSSEVFPLRVKGVCAGICTCYGMLNFFFVSKISPLLFLHIGHALTYAVFGCCVTIGCFILMLVLPETKGKTLVEIEQLFNTKK